MSDTFIQVVTTTSSAEEARQIGEVLVQEGLAACVQIVGPIASVYRWRGQIEKALEWQCVIKTSLERYAAVEAAIRKLHSYEIPEIVAIPFCEGSEAYFGWIRAELKQVGDP